MFLANLPNEKLTSLTQCSKWKAGLLLSTSSIPTTPKPCGAFLQAELRSVSPYFSFPLAVSVSCLSANSKPTLHFAAAPVNYSTFEDDHLA